MAHITLTHPDAADPIKVPESARQHFLSMGWKEAKPAHEKPLKQALKTAIKTPVKHPLNKQ